MRSVAAIAVIALVLVIGGGGSVLNRIDRLKAELRATESRVRLVEARAELDRALGRHVAQREPKPDNMCLRRTDALRAALFALVRTGNASMVGDPSWEWAAWR